jgi:hypothetical protein
MDFILFMSVVSNLILLFFCGFFWRLFADAANCSSTAHDAFLKMRDLYDAQRRKEPSWAGTKRKAIPASNVIPGPGYDGPGVYIIQCQTRYKIGQSRNITKRLRSYGTAIPFPWKVYAIIPTAHPEALEAHFHETLAAYRVQGEWFEFGDSTGPLDSEMDRVREEAA